MHNRVLYNVKAPPSYDKSNYIFKKLFLFFFFIILFAVVILYIQINDIPKEKEEKEKEVQLKTQPPQPTIKYPRLVSGKEHPHDNLCDTEHLNCVYYASGKNELYLCNPKMQWEYLCKLYY
jgi:predicted membrane protein